MAAIGLFKQIRDYYRFSAFQDVTKYDNSYQHSFVIS